MTGPSKLAWAGLAVAALLSYFQYPGHIYLESDTQIYVPMFERFRDPGLLGRDPMVTRAHTAFTLYDEIARTAATLTGLDFEGALGILHVLVRISLLAGIFLITRAMGLSEPLALACAGIYALGGRVAGPSVLLVEYEPVPRAFALGPVLLALGLVAHGRYRVAGLAGAVGFLLHPTTSGPYWTVYAALLFVPDEPEEMKKRLWALLPLGVAVMALKLASGWQPGVTERQALLARVDPAWEELIRLRASYVWVSMWPRSYFWQYGCMLAMAGAAFWKLRRFLQPGLRFFLVGLCGLGVLSLPFSYVLLEKLKWGLLPQAQPLRTILFLELFALLGALVMAFELACKEGKLPAAAWWGAAGLAVGIDARLLPVLTPLALGWLCSGRWRWVGTAVAVPLLWAGPWRPREMALALGLGALLVLTAWWSVRRRAAAAAVLAVVAAAFFVVPGRARFHWSGQPANPELAALATWARENTPRDAVFLFADAGRSLEPGIFRARAGRALYVDWKGGGQVNFFKEYSREWWRRWQATLAQPYRPERLPEYAGLGIDYLVLGGKNRLPAKRAAFENGRYVVYGLNQK
jgi:hypothetical protein